MDLTAALVEFYRKVATSLPRDVEEGLRKGLEQEEKESVAYQTLETILENVVLAREKQIPICQDTGTPIFFVKHGPNFRAPELRSIIQKATHEATASIPLRPNAVDVLTGRNTGDNVWDGIPLIYFEEWDKKELELGLLLKGGGSENIGLTYKLPDSRLKADRDLEGVRRCVLDAAFQAQGKGCPPMIVSVTIGSPKDFVAVENKRQLLRKLNEKNPEPKLAALEEKLTSEINSLGIGPGGFGGKTTVFRTFVTCLSRHPASFFVEVGFFCWAARRGKMTWQNGQASFDL